MSKFGNVCSELCRAPFVLGRKLMTAGVIAQLFVGSTIGAGVVGCGGDNTLEFIPVISITVDSKKVTLDKAAACLPVNFSADDTSGQLTQTKKVIITNNGIDGSVLCLKAPVWDAGKDKLYKMEVTKGATPTSTECLSAAIADKNNPPAAVPGVVTALAPNKSITFTITYTASPGLTGAAKLSIEHNGGTQGTSFTYTKNEMCFGIAEVGPQIVCNTPEFTYHNASAANPPTQCFTCENHGTGELCFDSSNFTEPNSQYSVTKQPQKGDCLARYGDPQNPVANPKQFEMCVRYTPDSSEGNEKAQLYIKTNDASQPKVTIPLDAVTDAQSSYKVTCKAASGALMYDFKGTISGVKETTCNIYNNGPSSFTLNAKPEIIATSSKDKNVDLSGIYDVSAHKPDDSPFPVDWNFSIVKEKSLDFIVKLTYPTDGKLPPQAQLLISFTQVPNGAGKVILPIVVGGDDTPSLSYGPEPLWQQADVGKSTTGTLVLANQSPSTLQLLDACILADNLNLDLSKDPCGSNTASKTTVLVPGFGLHTMLPWELYPLQIAFSPLDDKKITRTELLHITWCSTKWDGKNCATAVGGGSGLVVQSIGLAGNIEVAIAPPTLTLDADDGKAVAGKPVIVTGKFVEGTLTGSCHNFAWAIKSRPAGSMLWKGHDEQNTDSAKFTFVPDLAGDYKILAMGQTCDATDPAKVTWSKQVELTIKVAATP